MPIIALQGIRGGTGTTALTSALAWALNQSGESVIALDFSPCNQLGIHFNTPVSYRDGWMRAALEDREWGESAMRYLSGLDFIPFGRLDDAEHRHYQTFSSDFLQPWIDNDLNILRQNYRWILLDMPTHRLPLTQNLLHAADRAIRVITPDANCHLRLHRAHIDADDLYLLNLFNVNSAVQRDLRQLWSSTLQSLLPIVVHQDEAFSEALMMKQPVGEYQPSSLATEEIATLAAWLQLNVTERTA
ncbi:MULTISPECIES: cellulose biosynthesis protein BcsQ [Lonsdalea]|uniref:Cell division protein n=2 Tax=Lonsdalea TaxID=1082702 RepID=A0ACD1JCE4_9GAMM|nr:MULTISPECIES: cellulose biosynthesis protein BcsQ [Lonsdalea]OSN02091.1 cell division protein [Lonsdalea populi]QPQ23161.1 cellulose synthase operon protein YhjQ [Lonsdalea populi]RAT13354.1 cell division protein [Lonsdalea quercina]RAT14237.1 cell division protein [Lonsdalea quercina]RAT21646.1 cell division protein [Lonsdalea populi]